jgi:cell division protein ZapA
MDDIEQSKTTVINIYGVNYTIDGEIDPEKAKALASYVDGKMWELSEEGSIASSTKLAVLAALNIAEDYFKMATARQKEMEFAHRHIARMLKMLDAVMTEELFPEAQS